MDCPRTSLKILLVENHDDTLVYLTKYMEKKGHFVIPARDMASAMQTLEETAVNVLISDIGLPDGDGWELMRKAVRVQPSPYGIAMSGFGMRSDREKSLQAGFRHHLIKPFLPEELDELLEAAAQSVAG